MVDPGSAVTAGKMGFEVVRWSSKRGPIKNAIDRFRPKYHVLVIGTSGAGKTNFLNSLAEPSARAVHPQDRTKFMAKRRLALPKHPKPFVFYDTPGQQAQISERMQTILKLSGRRGTFGIINVVAYGYNESGSVPAAQAISGGIPDPNYLQRQRELERAALDEWVGMASTHKVDYVITLVTKADLWTSQAPNVVQYYEAGSYAARMQDARVRRHAVVQYASTISDFFGTTMSSGFNLDDLLDLRSRFEREIVNAVAQ